MKIKLFIGLFLLLILVANISFASYSTVTMEVVEEPICSIDLDEGAKFEKKLIGKDLQNKEVTLQLQVSSAEIFNKPTGELMLVLDNSNSMTDEVSDGKTRKDLIFETAKNFISELLKDNTKLKIGIVSFSTNTDITKEGTLEDATLISALSNSSTALSNAISQIETDGPRTNLQSGLLLASEQFTEEANNKYMIVLTDGVPNVAIDYDKNYYSNDVISKTKEQLQSLASNKIEIFTMLSGISDENYVPVTTTKSFGEIIREIFGTYEDPTVGNFYYVSDNKIEETIANTIYNSLIPTKKVLKDITVIDYFPAEIVKNFDFAYVSNANIGTISAKIDETTNSITWNIPELLSGETATVQYKLKLKENFDSSIVDKILNTNEKVDVNYTGFDGKEQTKTSDVSPKIKLTEPTPAPAPKEEPKEAPKELPKAGSFAFASLGILVISIFTFSSVKLIVLNKKIK